MTFPASIEASSKRKAYLNIVLPAFLISVIAYLDRNNLSYAKLTMNDDLGFSESAYGFGAGIFFAGYLLFEIPGALIAERFSARLWLARIMISWGLLTGLMAFVTAAWQFYLLRFAIGVAEASLYPVLYATVIPRWFAPRDRARAIAVMLSSLQISAIVGAPLASFLIETPVFGLQGWQVLFLVEAVPAVLFGFVVIYWMADRPRDAWWLSEEEEAFLSEQLESDQLAKGKKQQGSVLAALKSKEVLKLSGTYFLWMTGYWGFTYYTPTILKDLGWATQDVGWLVAAAMAASLVMMLLVGHSSSRTGEKRWHGAAGLFLASLGMFFGTLTQNALLAYVCLCMAGIGVYAALGVWWSYPTTFLRGAAAAGAAGLINSIGSAGGFVGPYVTGFVKDATGSYRGAWVYLAVSLAAAGVLILTLKRPEQIEGDKHHAEGSDRRLGTQPFRQARGPRR
jgi:ACS family tartrate transporter-like MFS transporter